MATWVVDMATYVEIEYVPGRMQRQVGARWLLKRRVLGDRVEYVPLVCQRAEVAAKNQSPNRLLQHAQSSTVHPALMFVPKLPRRDGR
ncbi:unnamed protein product [Urochloa humidicola]